MRGDMYISSHSLEVQKMILIRGIKGEQYARKIKKGIVDCGMFCQRCWSRR